MKKIILIGVIALLGLSCSEKQAELSGVITYFYNEHQGYKSDVGAELYATTNPTDSIEGFLELLTYKHHLDILDSYKEFEQEYTKLRSTENIERMKKSVQETEDFLLTLDQNKLSIVKDQASFDAYSKNAYRQLFRIKSQNDCIKTTINGTGDYSLVLTEGKWKIIAISKNRTAVNMLESSGCILLDHIDIKSGKANRKDFTFELK